MSDAAAAGHAGAAVAAPFDVAVVGAGIAGLAAAALLARAGRRVVVLEAHSLPGGCASYFTRERFRFDVGATTLSGMRADGPVARLLATLGIDPVDDLGLVRHDPGVVFHDERGVVRRFADPARWRAEAARACAAPEDGDFGRFVAAVEATADRAWHAAPRLGALRPSGLREWAAWLSPARIGLAALLPALRRPVAAELARCGVQRESRAWRFVAEQLAITTQRSPEETPWLMGAMGLAYPRDTWSVRGGLGALPQAMVRVVQRAGGELRWRTRAIALRRLPRGGGSRFEVAYAGPRGARGALAARALLFTPPLAALATACPELAPWCADRQRGGAKVGAFTLCAGLRFAPGEALEEHGTPFHQLLLPAPLPWGGGRSLFLSFSRADEPGRAPPGSRALTVSTHVDAPAAWASGRFADDAAAVDSIAAAMRAAIERAFPSLARAEWRPFLPGTPRTFARYTLRPDGAVGGLGHGLALPPWRAAGARTPLPGLYLAGDTVFPGQGTPAVVQSAENAVQAIERDG